MPLVSSTSSTSIALESRVAQSRPQIVEPTYPSLYQINTRVFYWVGPFVGTVVAILACSFLASRIEVAKVYHFDSDRSGIFHMMSRSTAPEV